MASGNSGTPAPYLDEFLDSLKKLPVELEKNLILIRDIDSIAQKHNRNIDKLAMDLMDKVKFLSTNMQNKAKTDIQRQYDIAKQYCDDKIELSTHNTGLVEDYIKELDLKLTRFECDILDRALNATKNVEENSSKRGSEKTKIKKIKKESASREEETVLNKTSKKRQNRKGIFYWNTAKKSSTEPSKTTVTSVVPNPKNPSVASVVSKSGSLTDALAGAGVAISPEELDMPVDPNEPTYCLCNQVSYGKMICCDNPDCPFEWFHFECVEVTTEPKGKWFCPTCLTNKKKK